MPDADADVDRAVHAAFDGEWGALTGFERSRQMHRRWRPAARWSSKPSDHTPVTALDLTWLVTEAPRARPATWHGSRSSWAASRPSSRELVELVAERARRIVLGNPLHAATEMGHRSPTSGSSRRSRESSRTPSATAPGRSAAAAPTDPGGPV